MRYGVARFRSKRIGDPDGNKRQIFRNGVVCGIELGAALDLPTAEEIIFLGRICGNVARIQFCAVRNVFYRFDRFAAVFKCYGAGSRLRPLCIEGRIGRYRFGRKIELVFASRLFIPTLKRPIRSYGLGGFGNFFADAYACRTIRRIGIIKIKRDLCRFEYVNVGETGIYGLCIR